MAYAHKLAELANQITNLTEAPMLAPSTGTSMFGYSKSQFEMKIRQLLQRMGFEKGINKMEIGSNGKMMLHFANAAKARDFMITFNGMVRRMAKGGATAAQMMTTFDKNKSPGTAAVVSVDFSVMMKKEDVEVTEDIFVMLESLHDSFTKEETSTEE